jgi:hypothetical protein
MLIYRLANDTLMSALHITPLTIFHIFSVHFNSFPI